MPLLKHEKANVLIGDMVKILLEELEVDNECFGASTFKRQDMAKGIEPDECFYLENAAQMIGKDRPRRRRRPIALSASRWPSQSRIPRPSAWILRARAVVK
jgi:Uma2 family endonuclease